ncbi:hypothetical protein GCM10022246_15400 [Pedobacter ginsengiterrae]|uniref:Uncharacterized protein n=1 Tax=Pedobacter ginsengiterrae TaxID=871696 RepID=A0ABP7PCR9_9SPHI
MPNIKEAYQAVIDFNKTIISITSAILAALISFLVFQDYTLSLLNLVAPVVFVLSLIFSILGIGRAIPAINLDQSKKWAVRFSNLGAGLMILGIISIYLIKKPEKATIDTALSDIEKTLSKIYPVIRIKNCQKIELMGENYLFHFKEGTISRKVIYSLDTEKIILSEVE